MIRLSYDVLAFHGPSMNGGIAHAIEVVGPLSAKDAADGYRLMGSTDLAGLIDEALALAAPGMRNDGRFESLDLDDETSEALDALDERLSEDSDLEQLFRGYLAAHADQFEPL